MLCEIDQDTPRSERQYYRWFYEHVFSRVYDPGVRLFLRHFGGEADFRRRILSGISFSPGEKVLDLCCGTGGLTFVIADKADAQAEITSLDLSAGQLRQAERKNRRSNVKFIRGDAAAMDLPSLYFDKVFIGHALHEMYAPLRRQVLKEAGRVLRVGGSLVVMDFNRPPAWERQLWLDFWLGRWIPYPLNFEQRTMADMFRHSLREEVAAAGFLEVERDTAFNQTMQVVTAKRQRSAQC